MRKSKTRSWLISLLTVPTLAFQTHTSLPKPSVSYIDLMPKLSQGFPNRTKEAKDAIAYDVQKTADAAKVARVAAKAAAQTNVVQAAPVQPTGDVQALIVKWANYYGISSSWLLGVASCESGYNPNAINHNYFAGGGNPTGVFQFLPDTFARYSSQAGFVGNIFNADDNVHAAAYAFAHGGSGEWECK